MYLSAFEDVGIARMLDGTGKLVVNEAMCFGGGVWWMSSGTPTSECPG